MTAPKPVQSILFVCTMNAVRSPLAEGMAKALLGRRVYIDSAGLRKSARDPFAIAALREIDVEFSDDEPHTLDEIDFEGFDLVVTLSQEARMALSERARATAVELLHWKIDDPTLTEGSREARLVAYRAVRDMLRALIKERIAPRIARLAK